MTPVNKSSRAWYTLNGKPRLTGFGPSAEGRSEARAQMKEHYHVSPDGKRWAVYHMVPWQGGHESGYAGEKVGSFATRQEAYEAAYTLSKSLRLHDANEQR